MRPTFLILGFLTLAIVWVLLPQFGPSAFYVHMTIHMGVVAVAAPFLALGIAGGRADPVAKRPAWFLPIPISLVELAVVWAWHAPALHHAARNSWLGLFAEQSMFFICGLLLWLSAFGGDSPPDANRAAAGVIGLLLTMMHMVLLGALLALTPRPLYTHAAGHSALTPLEDQHLGGTIMLVGGGLSYLLGGLLLTVRLLRVAPIKPQAREA